MRKFCMQAIGLALLAIATGAFAQTIKPAPATPIQGLPPGLTISAAGIVSGTPALGSLGSYQFNVQVCDSELVPLCSPITAVNLLVVGPVVVSTTGLPPAIQNVPYNQPLGATGGVPPYSWTQH